MISSFRARSAQARCGWLALLSLAAILSLNGCGARQRQIAGRPLSLEFPPVVQPAASAALPAKFLQDKDTDKEPEDEYREAAEFYRLKRAGPQEEELPVERYISAREHVRKMPTYSIGQGRFVTGRKNADRAADIGSWTPLGPGNVGGRTRSLIIRPDDPNTMYAGAVGGGVWKTTDGGASWLPLSDLLPSIGISAMAMDNANPDTLYAGSGEYYTNSVRGDSIRGVGIYKTTDGGASWNLLPATTAANTTSFFYVNKIVISPLDSNRVYAATYGGVWRSLDAGVTWTRSLNRASPNLGCQDLVIRTDQTTDYLFASCFSRAAGTTTAVFRNKDAAGSGAWDSILTATNMDRTSLALAPSNQDIIYAMAASQESGDNLYGLLAVFRSVNSGDLNSWEARTDNKDGNRLNRALLSNPREAFLDVCSAGKETFVNQGEYDNVLAVDPLNPDVVWAGGVGIMRSDDGGANWGIASFWEVVSLGFAHADVHVLAFHPQYDGKSNQTLFTGNDGGVHVTSNALARTATGDRAACSPYPSSVRWKSLNNGYAATQFYHGAVYPGGASYVGGTQDNGTVQGFDTSGPIRWFSLIGGDGGFFAIDPSDPNILFGETTNLSLRRSSNGGFSFATSTRGITEASANFIFIAPFILDPSESKRLYIGGRTLWRSNDSAANWSEASAPIPSSSGSISAIAVAPSDSKRAVFGTTAGLVYRNSNALATDKNAVWESSSPRAGYLSRLTFHPQNPDILYATYSQFKTTARDSHVYKSSDGGVTWTGIDGTGDSSIPDIPVFSLIVDPQNPSTLYVGSDIGVFVSVDDGATWARDDNPFATAVTEVLVLDRSAGASNLYAFTHGRGVWKTTLPGSAGPCQYTLSADSVKVSALGGSLVTNVDTADGCAWSAITVSGNFPVASPAGATGAGKVTINTSTNYSTNPLGALVSVQDKTFTVQQDPAARASGNDSSNTPFALPAVPGVAIQDSSAATEQPTDPTHSCTSSADSKTLWFSITANDTGTLRVGFRSARLDNGADSGAVMTVYRSPGAELGCSLTPQATNVITTRFLSLPVNTGDKILVEVSATLSGAPAGSRLLGGNVGVSATILK